MTRLEAWNSMLGHFPAAGAELLAQRELSRRCDSKFVMPVAVAAAVLRTLTHDYALLHAGAERIATYRTLYFDTTALQLFHEHRRGRRVRHKVRVRHYDERRLSVLEIKTRKSELSTSKITRPRAYGASELDAGDRAFVQAWTHLGGPVLPQVWTEYRRVTLLGIGSNERVTVDLDFAAHSGGSRRSIGELAIVEIKQPSIDRRTPVMSALRAAGRRQCWFTKYCVGIAWTHPDTPMSGVASQVRRIRSAA